MQMSSDSLGEIHKIHFYIDGFKWIITEKSGEGNYHGVLFAPNGGVLAHFYHEWDMSVESRLRQMLSYYREKSRPPVGA